MLKKLLLSSFVFLFLVMSANSVTYLNSCGKSSGWLEGETYILNFTEIPSGYVTGYCFLFPRSDSDNFELQGTGELIELNSASVTRFIQWNSAWGFEDDRWHNVTLRNINIVDTDGTGTEFIQSAGFFSLGWHDNDIRYSTFEDLTVLNFNSFFRHQSGTSGESLLIFSNMDNVFFIGNYAVLTNVDKGLYGSFTTNISNSAFVSKLGIMGGGSFVNNFGGFNFTDSALIGPSTTPILIDNLYINNEYDSSVISYYNHTDSNDDNVADSFLYTNMNNMNIYQDVRNYRFMQDSFEGFPFMNQDNKNYVLMRDENLSFSNNIISLGAETNAQFMPFSDYVNLNSISSVILGNSNNMTTLPYTNTIVDMLGTSSGTGDEDGYILLRGNTKIIDISFNLNKVGGEGSLATNFDMQTLLLNPEIFGNTFTVNQLYSSANGEVFDFVSDNLQVHDNTFTLNTFDHEIFKINDNHAKIYENIFTVSSGQPNLCNTCLGTYFYNNNMGSGINVSQTSGQTNLYLNSTTTYISGGTVYYFNIGNYWADNIGCVDVDVNGICDSQFDLPNGYTDFKPLATYPFDFASHLLTADDSVPLTNFTVNLIDPINGSSYNFTNTNEIINITFNHDSAFSDMSCSYLFNNSPVFTVENAPSNTNITNGFTGWSNETHNVKVRCVNEFLESTSNEIIFTTNVQGTTTPGNGGGNDTTTPVDSPYSITGTDIIDINSPTNTADNIIEFGGNIGAFLFNILLPALVFIAIIGALIFLVVIIK